MSAEHLPDAAYLSLSFVFGCIGAHAAAAAIRATDVEDAERIRWLANAAQYECIQGRLQRHYAIVEDRRWWIPVQEAYRAVNDALLVSNRARTLRTAEKLASTLAEEARAAAGECARWYA